MASSDIKESSLSMETIAKLTSVFQQYPEIDLAILYGSRAKGTFQTYSDVDIALVGKMINSGLQTKIEFDIDDLMLPYKFDLSIYHRITNQDLLDHIDKIGKKLYSKNAGT